MRKILKSEKGLSLIELLVSIVLAGILGVGITQSTVISMRTVRHSELNHIASSLATSKMEELAAVNVSNVDASDGGTESSISWPGLGITFKRVTTVTVNPDNSRTVNVRVESNSTHIPTEVEFNNTFTLWE